MASHLEDWRSPNKRKIVIQKLEESIKALGNPPANLQNPVEVEKAFFEKSKNKEEYMNYFHNVILMLSQRQKQTHQQGNPMMNQARPMMNMGPGQPPMGMNQPNPGYQQPYNQFGGMGGNQVPNPSYQPGGGMGMGGPQRPQQPPQYHSTGMYPPGGNPNMGMHMSPQQPRYPGNMGMSQGYPHQRPMNYSGHHSIGVMGGGGGGGAGFNPMSGHYNQPQMVGGGQGGGGIPSHHGGGPMMHPGPMMQQTPMRNMPPRAGERASAFSG